jgi:hypothetical protein
MEAAVDLPAKRKSGRLRKLALVLFISASLLPARMAFAQGTSDSTVSLQLDNVPLEHILDTLTQITGYRFAYYSDLVKNIPSASILVEKMTFQQVLDTLLHPNALSWERIDRQIVIGRKPPAMGAQLRIRNKDPFKVITGKIVDGFDGKPIPYVNISLVGRSIGTISNNDGGFVFKIPADFLSDTIAISCIGFKTVRMSANDFVDDSRIRLMPESIMIREVIVRTNDPKNIIRKAIEAIPRNYQSEPVMQTGFYREIVRKNAEYIMLSEAVVDIFKASYIRNYQNDQVRLFKGRKSDDASTDDTVIVKLQGGLYNSLQLDIVKNIPSFMDENAFQFYEYHMGVPEQVGGNLAYAIEFDQKEGVQDVLFKGKLLIDVNSLAILGARFSISPKGIDEAASRLIKKAPMGIKAKPLGVDYIVNYQPYRGKWQVNHIRVELRVRVRKKHELFNSVYTSVSEMVITSTDSIKAHPFRNDETVKPNQVFVDHIGTYDASYWGEFNFIKPEVRLEEAINEHFFNKE